MVDYPQSPQKFPESIPMRAGSLLIAATLIQTSVAYAAEPMVPNDIKATFFNGKRCLTFRHKIHNDFHTRW
jgi:hypothetical protein